MNKTLTISGRTIGPGLPCFVIAEAGLNHNGDLSMARRLIDAAVDAGADAVKFQKRTVDILAIEAVLDTPDGRFPSFGRTYREIREHLEFDAAKYGELVAHARGRGIPFLCTPFDIPAVDFLEPLDLPAYKVASHSLTNLPMLAHLATRARPAVMSTGMCELSEIDAAVDVFVRAGTPLGLMHCVSAYPQPVDQSNLRMVDVLRERYGVPVGYSGHELGTLPTLAAVARGAALVERHLTLDRTLEGFDHRLSLTPDEFAAMVREIRDVERTLGSGMKAVSETEVITRRKYHVSIVSAREIQSGEVITMAMLTLKNPGTGMPASALEAVVGRPAAVRIQADSLIAPEMLG